VAKVLEKDVEAYLRDRVLAIGCGCHKYINDARRGGTPGFPDRIVILPDGYAPYYVEVKRPDTVGRYRTKRARYFESGDTTGCSKTEIRQFREQRKLLDLGQMVRVAGTFTEVDALVADIEAVIGDVEF